MPCGCFGLLLVVCLLSASLRCCLLFLIVFGLTVSGVCWVGFVLCACFGRLCVNSVDLLHRCFCDWLLVVMSWWVVCLCYGVVVCLCCCLVFIGLLVGFVLNGADCVLFCVFLFCFFACDVVCFVVVWLFAVLVGLL